MFDELRAETLAPDHDKRRRINEHIDRVLDGEQMIDSQIVQLAGGYAKFEELMDFADYSRQELNRARCRVSICAMISRWVGTRLSSIFGERVDPTKSLGKIGVQTPAEPSLFRRTQSALSTRSFR